MPSTTHRLYRSLQAGIAAALCAALTLQPMPALAKKRQPLDPVQQDQRILHALNRFTFGPEPGDLDAVRRMGLDRWFDQQLHPGKIDDSALDARLAEFPAMRLNTAQLLHRYPSNQELRQVEQGKLPMPSDPVEAAIYRDGLARYQQAKKQQEAKAAAELASTASPDVATMVAEDDQRAAFPGDGVNPSTPSMMDHNEQFFSGLEAVRIINLPPAERMGHILALSPDQLVAFRRALTLAERRAAAQDLSADQREILAALLDNGPRLVGAEVLSTRLLRDLYSQRQLEAVMTDFWLNHFNAYIRKNQNEPYLLNEYESTIRAHALGRFEDLLVAVAKSPAMLTYLDNAQSIGPDSFAAQRASRARAMNPNGPTAKARPQGLNENYARELMELHTLGVNGGYTQADVTQVARVFTGWTVDPGPAQFSFEERRHEPGTKTVMRRTIHEGGEREGLEVLHLLASSPATARFLSTKLAVRFVSDTPPPALVERMTKAYLDSDGDIAKVMRAMFDAPEFWAPAVENAKMKTPLEFVVSSVRATGAEIDDPLPLVRSLDRLGMPLYGMQTPNGYSWTAESWVSTGALVNRMNFAIALSGNRLGGSYIDWSSRLSGALQPVVRQVALHPGDDNASVKELQLEKMLLGRAASEQTRSTVLQQVQDHAAQLQAEKNFSIHANDPEPMGALLSAGGPAVKARPPLDRDAAVMAGLLLGSPEFQRR